MPASLIFHGHVTRTLFIAELRRKSYNKLMTLRAKSEVPQEGKNSISRQLSERNCKINSSLGLQPLDLPNLDLINPQNNVSQFLKTTLSLFFPYSNFCWFYLSESPLLLQYLYYYNTFVFDRRGIVGLYSYFDAQNIISLAINDTVFHFL